MYNMYNTSTNNDMLENDWHYGYASTKPQRNAPYTNYTQHIQHSQHHLPAYHASPPSQPPPAFNHTPLPNNSLLITSLTFTSSTLATANPGLIPLSPPNLLPGEGIIPADMLERCAEQAWRMGGWLEVLDARGWNGEGEEVVGREVWEGMGACEVRGVRVGWPVVRYAVRGLVGDRPQGMGAGRPRCGGVIRGSRQMAQQNIGVVSSRTRGWVEKQAGMESPLMVKEQQLRDVKRVYEKNEEAQMEENSAIVNWPVREVKVKLPGRLDKGDLKQQVLDSNIIEEVAPNEAFFEPPTTEETVAADKAVQEYAVQDQARTSDSRVERPATWANIAAREVSTNGIEGRERVHSLYRPSHNRASSWVVEESNGIRRMRRSA